MQRHKRSQIFIKKLLNDLTYSGRKNKPAAHKPKKTLESTWHKTVWTRLGVLNACLYPCEDDSRPLFLSEWVWVSLPASNRLFVFVQTPSLADLIKIHFKYHLFKCVLDGLVFVSCPFKQIQILIMMEMYYIAERERCQSWCAFTSKSCVLCSNLIYVTVSEDGNIKSSVVVSVAAAFCGNRELPGNQTVTISTFRCLL